MKRLILVCAMACCAAPMMAQTGAATTTTTEGTATDSKRMLSIKLNELAAYTSRNSTEHVQKTLQDITGVMQQCIAESKARVSSAPAAEKAEMSKTYRTQAKLADEVKSLAANPYKNRAAIEEKVNAFQQTL